MRLALRTVAAAGVAAAALMLLASSGPAAVEGAPDRHTRVVYDQSRGVVEFLIGPFDLPGSGGAHQHGHAGAFLPPITTVDIPADVRIYGAEYDLVDADGRVLPTELLHHINLIDPATRELFLPISRRIAAAGRETGTVRAPWLLFGYPLRQGTPIVVAAMLHNETERDYHDVTLRYRLLAVPGKRPWPVMTVYPFQLDVLFPHGDKSFDLPPGRSTRSYEARPAIAGRVVAIGGHTHDYATRLALEDVAAGRVIWEASPQLDSTGAVRAVPVGMLWQTLGARLEPDRAYRVTVEYDNPTGDTIPQGGMGVVAGIFAPDGDWPAADTTDPDYQADRRHYLRLNGDDGMAEHEEHHH